jgi:hypothetical protein
VAILKSNGGAICRYGIESTLQNEGINSVVKLLYFMVKRAGFSMRHVREKQRKEEYWRMYEKKDMRDALRDFRVKMMT